MRQVVLIVMLVIQTAWAGAQALRLVAEWRLYHKDAPAAAALYPWDYKYALIVGGSNVAHRNFPDAARRFENVLARAPYHIGALINLAGVYWKTGDRKSAERTLVRALALAPTDQKVRRNLQIVRMRIAGKYEFLNPY